MPGPLRIVLGALLTLVVMVIAIIPPILHFFTGPIGPGIGGFLAGRQLKLSDKEAAAMGVLLALLTGVPAFILMNRVIDNDAFAVSAAVVSSLWSGGLATLAAWFAGSDDETEEETATAE